MPALVVRGRADLLRAFGAASKDAVKEVRQAERGAAEPVRSDAESLAVGHIRRVGLPWSRMRVGVTTRAVYIAPKQRGVQGRDQRRRRPNLAGLLVEQMEAALERNAPAVERAYEEAMDNVGRRWERY